MAEASFIPKSSDDYLTRPKESLGIFMVIGIIVFILAVAGVVGLIFYKQHLNAQIEQITQDIKKKEQEFNQEDINEWARTAEAIDLAKQVMGKHRYVSNVFTFIQRNTLPDVRYSKFEFDASTQKIVLDAEAKNYTAIAMQRAIYTSKPEIGSISLSNFNLDKTGRVGFKIDLSFNPNLLTAN